MEILTPKEREALSKYPLYSQDGKQGEAVAVVRLFITGTAATYYITGRTVRRFQFGTRGVPLWLFLFTRIGRFEPIRGNGSR